MGRSLSIGIIIGNNWILVDPRTGDVWVKGGAKPKFSLGAAKFGDKYALLLLKRLW